MFYYFYDSFLNHKKYKKTLSKIEAKLTDLEIGGKKKYLNPLQNMKGLVEEAIEKKAETLVAVGNDQTFVQMVNIVGGKDVVLGFIPLVRPNKIAKLLGIPSGCLACEVLSARLIETIDLGRVNQSYFFSSLEISGGPIVLEAEKYRIIPEKCQKVSICNFESVFQKISNPKDGVLETIIYASEIFPFRTSRNSLFLMKKIKIDSISKEEPISIKVDQTRLLKTPLSVEILPRKLKIIVGREREF